MSAFLENPSLTDDLQKEIVRRILTVGSPLKIVLFGSLARGDAKPQSDLDLLIVEASVEDPCNLIRKYGDALHRISRRDENVEVVSMKEILEWRSVPHSFLSSAVAQGRVLYQADCARQAAAEQSVVREGYIPKTNADLARGYFELAELHLATVRRELTGPGPYNDACFLAHQVIEKYLKGFIGFHGSNVPHTHTLEDLHAVCSKIEPVPELASFDLAAISKFYVEARYHRYFKGDKPTAQAAATAAEATRQAVLSRVPPEAHP